MIRWRHLALLAMLVAMNGRGQAAAVVNAADYEAFWLWAGVRPQEVLGRARTLYILQGQVEARGGVRLVSQRPALPRIRHAKLWMVVRVETIDWPPDVYTRLLLQLLRWRAAGNQVVGVQIDFDAATRGLKGYATFLADLRSRLPAGTKLGVTGLLDWSANGDPAGLAALGETVDEIVLQIYQGRRVIPGYAGYLAGLDRLAIPFRIGLLQGGEWNPPRSLAAHPWFRGYVIFLQNPVPTSHVKEPASR